MKGRKVPALIDSGATHCMIGESIPELKEKLEWFHSEVNATAINGSDISFPASPDFIVSVEGKEFAIHALFSPKVSYDSVLGYDFLRNIGCIINFDKVGKTNQCFIRTSEKIELKPVSETLVWGEINSSLEKGIGLVNCSSVMPQLDLCSGRA